MHDDGSENDLRPTGYARKPRPPLPLLNSMLYKPAPNRTRIVLHVSHQQGKMSPRWADAMQQHLDESPRASDEEIIAAFQVLPDQQTTEVAGADRDPLDAMTDMARTFLREAEEMTLAEEASAPPPPSSYLADLLVPSTKATDFVANLEEVLWERWVEKYGAKKAKWLWYSQICQFVSLHWLGVAVDLAKALPALIKLG